MMPALNAVALNDEQIYLVIVVDSALHMVTENLHQLLGIVFMGKAANDVAKAVILVEDTDHNPVDLFNVSRMTVDRLVLLVLGAVYPQTGGGFLDLQAVLGSHQVLPKLEVFHLDQTQPTVAS